MDKIFKIGLLVLGFSYLAYLFCPVSNQAGRYRYDSLEYGDIRVFDTKTAYWYFYDRSEKLWLSKGGIDNLRRAAKKDEETLGKRKEVRARKVAEQKKEQKRILEYKEKYEISEKEAKEIEEYKKRRIEQIRNAPEKGIDMSEDRRLHKRLQEMYEQNN